MIGTVTWRSRRSSFSFKTKISDLTSLSTDINRPPVSVSGVQAYWRTPLTSIWRLLGVGVRVRVLVVRCRRRARV